MWQNSITNNETLTIETIDEKTWIISEGTGKGRTHCYLLEGNDKAMLIDTGLTLIPLRELCESLTTKEIWVVNTHGHLDHISNNHQFDTIYMHSSDDAVLMQHRSYGERSSFIKQRFLDKGYSKEELQASPMKEQIHKQAQLPKQVTYTPIERSMRFDLGEHVLKIIETPGHTQGSICILDESYRRLFTGDTICEDGVLLHFPHSTTIQIFLDTLHKLKQLSNCYDTIYGGHQMVPLPCTILDAYIACATTILEGNDTPIEIASAAGFGYRSTIQGATISYLPSMVKERT